MNQYQAEDIIKQLYYPEKSFSNNEEILNHYASPEDGIGTPIEFPDRISNVNGVHNYKLLSSKDINFNNVLLPNSAVPDSNWGSFDEDRRWPSGYPVYINDVYELMNVVDYLLCATEDLWDEINRLRFGNATLTNLWFLNNLNNPIGSINKIDSSQFSKASNYAVLLNPKKYFTTLPSTTMANFGIGTHFFDENHADYPILRRVTQQNTNRNGIQGYIEYEDHNNYYKTQNENLDGRIVPIYGYLIGSDLHFYPMFNIDNFLSSAIDDYNNYDSLIDYSKMKLKYDLYFRINNNPTTQSQFVRVYIDFLYYNWESVGRPFILYFIDNNNKRQIIYIHTENNSGNNTNKTISQISNDLLKYDEYINNFYDVNNPNDRSHINEFGAELEVYSVSEGLKYPYLFHISDTSKINLFVQTPNTNKFTLIQNTLQIPYFKNINSLSANIKLPGDKIINSIDDKEQISGLLYSPQRYNVPDNTNIKIDITGSFLKNDAYIKYDDEFIDYLIPHDGNNFYVTTDEEAKQYYYYNGLDSNGKRKFEQFQTAVSLNAFFMSDSSNAITINNIDNVKCAHVYVKNNDAYKLKYKVVTNSLINQITDYPVVVEQSQLIENSMALTSDRSKYTLSFNYNLPGQLEQIKFDLKLYVDETSKVQSTDLNLPISFNKIHKPCIQFVSKDLMNQELKDYDIYLSYTFGDRTGGFNNYKYTNKVLPNRMTNTFLIFAEGNTKTNQNTVQGTNNNDMFNNFQELYTYVIERKYNNFEKKDHNNITVRTDILANIDDHQRYTTISNYANLEATFNKPFTYDNSIDGYMHDLIISYHPSYTMLNIIGSGVFENFLKNISNQSVDYVKRQAIAYFDNVTYSPSQGQEEYITFKSVFNINGLGFNYRLHGGDSYLYINKEGSGLGGHNFITDLPFNNQYDLLSNSCNNTENNIIKFMEISATDNDNEMQDIIARGTNVNNETGLFLETDMFDIYALSYEAVVQKDFYRFNEDLDLLIQLQNNSNYSIFTATYYTPITYINIKNSTFYPNREILPDNREYDLTDENIINTKYSKYIEYWNSDYSTNGGIDEVSKYKPITMTIKLNENLDNNTPFFYESNDAKLKFNIRRVNPTTIDDTSNSKYNPKGVTVNLTINQRYYLSDFIKVDATTKVLNSIGSLPEYDEDTGKFKIHEYYNNYIDERSIIYPKPIFKDNGDYIYIPERCSKLNKIHFKDSQFNGHNLNSDIIDQHVLYYFDANIENLMNLLSIDEKNLLFNDDSNGLKLILSNGTIYGNKNYLNLTVTGGPEIIIKFIRRTKPTLIADKIYIVDSTLEAPNNTVLTNKGDVNWDGTFEYNIIENGTIVTARFKHYQFYSLNQIISNDISHELLEIPAANLINKIYIYNATDTSMRKLSTYKDLTEGIINTGSFEAYYQTILTAFNNNTIYERIS